MVASAHEHAVGREAARQNVVGLHVQVDDALRVLEVGKAEKDYKRYTAAEWKAFHKQQKQRWYQQNHGDTKA